MTLRARRIYYSLAILVFCLVAPLIVATAAGWRWFGWRQGFVGTGTMTITAAPRATILIDGRSVGETPKRLSGLAPGRYHLALRRDGYQAWDHIIDIQQRSNTTIGPVKLFRAALQRQIVSPQQFDDWLVSADRRQIAGLTNTPNGVALQIVWPLSGQPAYQVSSRPDWIAVSQRSQRLAVGGPDATLVFRTADAAPPWTLAPGEPVQWLSSSESIFYRLENDILVAYDFLTQTRTELQSATSLSTDENSLWLSRQTSLGTSIERRKNTLAANAATVKSLPGEWRVAGTIPNGAFISTVDGRVASLLSIDRLTNRLAETRLGGLTGLVTNQVASHPIWIRGADVLTLNEDQPSVLLRPSTPLLEAEWIDPGDILATVDANGLIIRSVSRQQGRGTLVTNAWLANETPLLIDAASQSVLVGVDGQLQRYGWQ